jgi:hypothetical protein
MHRKGYGIRRFETFAPQWISKNERVRCAVEFCLIQNPYGNCKHNEVKAFAWSWGMSRGALYVLIADAKKSRQGLARQKPKRGVRYLDQPEMDALFWQSLIAGTRKKTSIEALTARFNKNNPKYKDISCASIARKLKQEKCRKVKRVYVQQLSPGNEAARFQMASEQIGNRWKHHFDLDEKWFFVVSTERFVWVCDDRMTKAEIEANNCHDFKYLWVPFGTVSY